jgi:hypothetical protein
MLPEDDERAALTQAVAPGEVVELALPLRAPAQQGEYLVVLDVVHEHIAWFAGHGSATGEMTLYVDPAATTAATAAIGRPAGDSAEPADNDGEQPAPIQMFCIEDQIVREAVATSGGTVIATWPSPDSGDDWDSSVYLVRRMAG